MAHLVGKGMSNPEIAAELAAATAVPMTTAQIRIQDVPVACWRVAC